MKVAIMQPYIFPYIGYFQLIHAVDTFVFYDDVNFIKGGWINRNNLLNANKAALFSIPLHQASSHKLINEVELWENERWKKKLCRNIELSYKKAPFYNEVSEMIFAIFNDNYTHIAEMAIASVQAVADYLPISCDFRPSSTVYDNQDLKGQDRVFDICKKEHATNYINPIGGQELYDKEEFMQNSMQLNFIKSKSINYTQFGGEFVPWLSIIDVLMFNNKEEIKVMLDKFELI